MKKELVGKLINCVNPFSDLLKTIRKNEEIFHSGISVSESIKLWEENSDRVSSIKIVLKVFLKMLLLLAVIFFIIPWLAK